MGDSEGPKGSFGTLRGKTVPAVTVVGVTAVRWSLGSASRVGRSLVRAVCGLPVWCESVAGLSQNEFGSISTLCSRLTIENTVSDNTVWIFPKYFWYHNT